MTDGGRAAHNPANLITYKIYIRQSFRTSIKAAGSPGTHSSTRSRNIVATTGTDNPTIIAIGKIHGIELLAGANVHSRPIVRTSGTFQNLTTVAHNPTDLITITLIIIKNLAQSITCATPLI